MPSTALWTTQNEPETRKLKNIEHESNWIYNDIRWRCIPNGQNCDHIEVDRDGKSLIRGFTDRVAPILLHSPTT